MSTNNAGRSSTGSDGDEEISTKEVWTVVSAFFRSRGFVQNQIHSFNKFFNQTLQEMVTGAVISFRPETRREVIHSITFLQLYCDKLTLTESDGTVADLYPNIARLRNFTYSASLYVDVCYKMIKKKT
ncbi:hypothetical protein Dsin_027544 [Dipteronia sinensis]|uniref:DNA-directed RNA polymerase n=1 Tax=Dipteronia sinensis TaxID=43782 RepID=A0AAD9ZNZ0_9ROSI|nr:hypothetical protein Dsin_027544 [Dipteronia sinensis]